MFIFVIADVFVCSSADKLSVLVNLVILMGKLIALYIKRIVTNFCVLGRPFLSINRHLIYFLRAQNSTVRYKTPRSPSTSFVITWQPICNAIVHTDHGQSTFCTLSIPHDSTHVKPSERTRTSRNTTRTGFDNCPNPSRFSRFRTVYASGSVAGLCASSGRTENFDSFQERTVAT